MRVYVAGAWVEKAERAMVWIARLQEAGVEITYDWTKDEGQSTAEASDANMPPVERARRALNDLYGVRQADVLWLLAPNERGCSGAWTEFGCALGLGKMCIISGAMARRTIFTSLAGAIFDTDAAAFDDLLIREEIAKRRVTMGVQK